MKIISKSDFEIMHITPDANNLIVHAARTCYKSEGISTPEKDEKLLRNIIKRKHTAMIEFGHIMVRFKNISRGMSHEAVRHRLASFAQQSTRYVNYNGRNPGFVMPPRVKGQNFNKITNTMKYVYTLYEELVNDGVKPEDARQILPIGTETELVVCANFREWREKIFPLRTESCAHWEIRRAMCALLKEVQKRVPIIFEDLKGAE